MSGIVIRKATEKDVNQIADLDKICFSVPWSEQSFAKELKENNLAFYILAESKETGQIVGYAGVWLIQEEGHITNVAVHPDFRRKHIGMTIIDVLMKESRKQAGIKTFTLEARKSNTVAIELYKKFGFAEVGIRKGYYQENKEDAVIMWTIPL
ncbi:MAG: ribosomal protein S18-alanine N-acetyltransferase [Peptostreptococcaceae bacterium]|nr:ribosomal protein S18-alanine N-acetyltransferase [Peptostreptococcaceae bacterium]